MSIDRNDPNYRRLSFDYSVHFLDVPNNEDRMYMSFRVEFADDWDGRDYVAHPAMQRWMYDPERDVSYSEDLSTPLVFVRNGTDQNGVDTFSAFFDFTMGENFLGFELFSYDPNPDAQFYRHILWGATAFSPVYYEEVGARVELVTVNTVKTTAAVNRGVTWSR